MTLPQVILSHYAKVSLPGHHRKSSYAPEAVYISTYSMTTSRDSVLTERIANPVIYSISSIHEVLSLYRIHKYVSNKFSSQLLVVQINLSVVLQDCNSDSQQMLIFCYGMQLISNQNMSGFDRSGHICRLNCMVTVVLEYHNLFSSICALYTVP